ncbi:proton channel OtopLc-like [Watersipora subatra]|uniref:proton channel OtopLc-like n=1 Tax=Watersipora subatra TaxID=2589382 RepID=UPI00355B964C
MQASTNAAGLHKDSKVRHNFSSYLKVDTGPAVAAEYKVNRDSSGSHWNRGGDLPPPPPSCADELVIQPNSIPSGPAKCWNTEASDDEMSDEAADKSKMDYLQDSDSASQDNDSESECPTEIYIPKISTTSVASNHQRNPGLDKLQQFRSKATIHETERGCDVIPSVSNDNLRVLSSAKPQRDGLAEEIATNIDSGISNETSHAQSQEGTTIRHRTMSVSSSSHYSSSYSCGSRGEIPPPTIGHQNRIDNIALYMKKAKMSRVVDFLSCSYAAILVLLDIILSLLSARGISNFQGFYIYQYAVGLLFLAYVYSVIIRGGKSPRSPQIIHRLEPMLPHDCSLNQPSSTFTIGSLFLRVAAALFCMGSLTDNGLLLGASFAQNCGSLQLENVILPVIQSSFILLQIYLVFNNAKLRMRDQQILTKFGVMHLIATNISTWILRSIAEIHTDIDKSYTGQRISHLDVNTTNLYKMANNADQNIVWRAEAGTRNCSQNRWMELMAKKAQPYVYPCTVQLCILSSCILFVVWRNVGTNPDMTCSGCRDNIKADSPTETRTIDCGNTSCGLVFGILTLIAAIASLIAFFMLTANNFYDLRATLIISIFHTAIYLIMTVISVVVLLTLRILPFNYCRETLFEDILVNICFLALLTFDLLSIISGILDLSSMKGLLVLASSTAELIQSLVQVSAIHLGLRLSMPNGAEELVTKPGRECVTFLAVTNVALWLLSIFSHLLSQDHLVQLSVIEEPLWSCLVNILSPITMLYHLSSAACFIDIWYKAYRIPLSNITHV